MLQPWNCWKMLRTLGMSAVAVLVAASQLQAATLGVYKLGDHGWISGDTRATTGLPANATEIAEQIVFMGEGQNVVDAAGAFPGVGPSGSLGGLGYVRLDGTNANPGKSDISIYGDFGSTEALLAPAFNLTFRYFNDPNPTNRTLGAGIGVLGEDGLIYALSYVDSNAIYNVWETSTINSSSLLRLYNNGAPGSSVSKTLADWEADSTWGSILFGDDARIIRFGFNLGSDQRNNLAYLDWMQSNLINGGDVVDFRDAALAPVVPEPASMAVWSMLALSGAAVGWRKRKALAGNPKS